MWNDLNHFNGVEQEHWYLEFFEELHYKVGIVNYGSCSFCLPRFFFYLVSSDSFRKLLFNSMLVLGLPLVGVGPSDLKLRYGHYESDLFLPPQLLSWLGPLEVSEAFVCHQKRIYLKNKSIQTKSGESPDSGLWASGCSLKICPWTSQLHKLINLSGNSIVAFATKSFLT